MKVIKTPFTSILCLLLLTPGAILGQACCSGGTPLSSTLGVQDIPQGRLELQLSYDYNTQRDLVSGSRELGDNLRERNTNSLLLRSSYAPTEKLSLTVLLSMVRQDEVTHLQTGGQSKSQAQGIGDAVVMGQYKLISDQASVLIIGAGLKLPVGGTNRVNKETGLPLHPDLQPGSGAWDLLGAAHFAEYHVFKPNLTFLSTLTYRLTTPADRYEGRQEYKFGNELRLLAGFKDSYLAGTLLVDPSILFLYRHTSVDKSNGFATPNTGGHWVHLQPGLDLSISQRFKIGASGEIPLYRKLTGTQLTTTYRLRLSLSYFFSLQKQEL